MKNLRLLAFATGGLMVATGLLVGACSSDDTVVTAPGTDSGTDTSKPDTGTPDVSVPDSGPDAPFDGGFKPPTYSNTIAEAMCKALARCCFGNANVPEGGAVDGGTFDRQECLNLYGDLGFESSNDGYDEVDAGSVSLDQAKAADCVAKIDALACELTGTAMQTIRTACFGALTGKRGNGQSCLRSIECAPGHFCNPADDGGLGTCTPLRGEGENCSTVNSGNDDSDSFIAEEACSYRAGGDTGRHCDSYDYTNGVYRARQDWTCQPNVANGQGCNLTGWCASGICDPNDFTCKSPLQYFSKYSCEAHVNP